MAQIREGLDKLQKCSQSDAFIRDALSHRHAKMLLELPRLSSAERQTVNTVDARVRHNPLATATMSVLPEIIDFRQPGEQILIHRGVEQCLLYIINTPLFRVGDIPGDVGDDIRLSLTNRFLMSGFLELEK